MPRLAQRRSLVETQRKLRCVRQAVCTAQQAMCTGLSRLHTALLQTTLMLRPAPQATITPLHIVQPLMRIVQLLPFEQRRTKTCLQIRLATAT